jgi:hypothetical protein
MSETEALFTGLTGMVVFLGAFFLFFCALLLPIFVFIIQHRVGRAVKELERIRAALEADRH